MDKNVVQHDMNRRHLLKAMAAATHVSLLFAFVGGCGRTSTAREAGNVTDLAVEIACEGNTLAFDTISLTVHSGQRVTLTFANVSTIFQHNWVLVAGGDDVAEEVNQAATAGGPARDYIPTDSSAILAHTRLTDPGESDTVTFTAPPPGEYTYLCTFPGHYLAGMQGTLVVGAGV